MLYKVSVDEVFMHYFQNMSSASVDFAPDGAPPLDPAGGLPSPDPLIYSLLKKIVRVPMFLTV